MKRTILVALSCVMLGGCFSYSDGERTGVITKLSRKGYFCKTWEAEMLIGGLRPHTSTSTGTDGQVHSSTSLVVNTWNFTIEDVSLLPKLKKAQEIGEPISVSYHQDWFTVCRSDSDGNYFAISVN